MNWPSRSLTFTPRDFFPLNFFKHNVFKTPCTSSIQVKRRIVITIRNIPTDMLLNVWQIKQSRLNAIIRGR